MKRSGVSYSLIRSFLNAVSERVFVHRLPDTSHRTRLTVLDLQPQAFDLGDVRLAYGFILLACEERRSVITLSINTKDKRQFISSFIGHDT